MKPNGRSAEEQQAWDEAVELTAREIRDGCATAAEARTRAFIVGAAASLVRQRVTVELEREQSLRQHRSAGFKAFRAGDWDRANQELSLALDLDPGDERTVAYLDLAAVHRPDFARSVAALADLHSRRFVYIAGCGRSGTWLLTALLSEIGGLTVLPEEAPVGRFLRSDGDHDIHVIKRHSTAWQTLPLIPDGIDLIAMVRHPFDVLCSEHLGKAHYISTDRWRHEAVALRDTMAKRAVKIVKFEDLVWDAAGTLDDLGACFGFDASRKAARSRHVDLPETAVAAMHGIRPPDRSRIEAWRRSPTEHAYLKQCVVALGETLSWFCDCFDYEIPEEFWSGV